MLRKLFRPVFLGLMSAGLVVAALGYADALAEESQEQPDRPKLVVLLIFDQMRGDYPAKWQELYDKDGFGRGPVILGGAGIPGAGAVI